MYPDSIRLLRFTLCLALIVSSDGFFLKWGSDTGRQVVAPKTWIQPLQSNMSPYRYQYNTYNPFETRKVYQIQPQYQPEPFQQSMAPIPISVPAGASLTPVSLQHVQLVPCMCPVAPEEAEKLHEQVGPGPYLAQTFTQPSYTVAQPTQGSNDNSKTTSKQ